MGMWRNPICPTARKERGELQGQECLSARINLLKDFLYVNQCEIENIIVYGHSCAIDFEYFNYLNARYANANWTFYVLKEEQESSVLQIGRAHV